MDSAPPPTPDEADGPDRRLDTRSATAARALPRTVARLDTELPGGLARRALQHDEGPGALARRSTPVDVETQATAATSRRRQEA